MKQLHICAREITREPTISLQSYLHSIRLFVICDPTGERKGLRIETRSPASDVAEIAWFGADELPPPSEIAFACVREALARWRRGGPEAGSGIVNEA